MESNNSISQIKAGFNEENDEIEQISEKFICCICLELLYKPVVLACGHASCFWCVHQSMSNQHESHCPICRHPYYHFPTICQMFHGLLIKMYPVTYKRRESQILEMEQKTGYFSPTFGEASASHSKEESGKINVQAQPSISQTAKKVSLEYLEHRVSDDNKCAASSVVAERQTSCSVMPPQILVDDMLCAICEQLLFRPVVLNCGHVYCQSCLLHVDGPLKCQICQSLHPNGFPKVYLVLDHFIKDIFPVEYLTRKNDVQSKQAHTQHEDQSNGSVEGDKDGVVPPYSSEKIHVGVGCDYCGMYPIIGDRYQCKDCKEAVGFDLCGDCYNSQSKLPGRFNQQHTSDHKFQIENYTALCSNMLRTLRSQSINIDLVQFLAYGNGENVVTFSEEVDQEDVETSENAAVDPSTPTIEEDHQDDIPLPTL